MFSNLRKKEILPVDAASFATVIRKAAQGSEDFAWVWTGRKRARKSRLPQKILDPGSFVVLVGKTQGLKPWQS
jgi:hypothetical protein